MAEHAHMVLGQRERRAIRTLWAALLSVAYLSSLSEVSGFFTELSPVQHYEGFFFFFLRKNRASGQLE